MYGSPDFIRIYGCSASLKSRTQQQSLCLVVKNQRPSGSSCFLPSRISYVQKGVCGEPHFFHQYPYVYCSFNQKKREESKIRYPLKPFSSKHLDQKNLCFISYGRGIHLFALHFLLLIEFEKLVLDLMKISYVDFVFWFLPSCRHLPD